MSVEYVPLCNLPSKYLLYPDLKPGDIQIRPLLGKDEKLMAGISSSNLERKFFTLLGNVLKGIDPKRITLGDRMYILLYLGIDTYGKDWPVEYVCEHCFLTNYMTVDLNSFDVRTLDEGVSMSMPVELSSGVIYLKIQTLEDEIKLAEYKQVVRSDEDVYLYEFALSIVDTTKTMEEKVKFLEEMPLKDLNAIKSFHAKFEHGPIMQTSHTCEHCGGGGIIPVPFQSKMVFRSGKDIAYGLREDI